MEVDVVDDTTTSKKLTAKELLKNDMLDHLSQNTNAHFKSQQRGDPDLLVSEKRVIAETILDRSCGTFLSRFGNYLLEDHLNYFADCPESERYEVDFYLKQIRASHNKSVSKVKVRNRRFEALKKLVNEGSYFSEYEMKKRNPLLYEQLIGKFLSEEEEKERTGVDTTNITFVNLLLEQYDRDQMKKLKAKQKEDEANEKEKDSDSDNEELENMHVDSSFTKMNGSNHDEETDDGGPIIKTLWGEEMTDKSNSPVVPSSSKENSYINSPYEENEEVEEEEEDSLSDDEKNLLMEEFQSSMFNSFLEGKDDDFDYDEVDKNSEYDDIDMRDLDEQEQYFDAETPENAQSIENSNQGQTTNPVAINSDTINCEPNSSISNGDVETCVNNDGIDKYIEELTNIENTEKITKKMETLHH